MAAIYAFLIANKMMTIDTAVAAFKEQTLAMLAAMGLDGYGNLLEDGEEEPVM